MNKNLLTFLLLAAIAAGVLYYFRDSIPFLSNMSSSASEMMPEKMQDMMPGMDEEVEAEGVMVEEE